MFITTVTPRFGDADGLRHINNIAISEWFEEARNPVFRFFTPDLNLSYEKWRLILARTEFDYVGEMYYGEDVEVRTFVVRIGNSSFTIGHEAWQRGSLRAKGQAVTVHYDFLNKRSVPIPDDIRQKLQEHLVSESKH